MTSTPHTMPFGEDLRPKILLLGYNSEATSEVEKSLVGMEVEIVKASNGEDICRLCGEPPSLALLAMPRLKNPSKTIGEVRKKFSDCMIVGIGRERDEDETVAKAVDAFVLLDGGIHLNLQRLARMAGQMARLKSENENLQERTSLDCETGFIAARQFLRQLHIEYKRACRTGEPLSLIVASFKPDNPDQRTLNLWVSRLSDAIRETDYLGRLGSAQFGIILTSTPDHGAQYVSDRIRFNLAGTVVHQRDLQIGMSHKDELGVVDSLHLLDKAMNSLWDPSTTQLRATIALMSPSSGESSNEIAVFAESSLHDLAAKELESEGYKIAHIPNISELIDFINATPPATLIVDETVWDLRIIDFLASKRETMGSPFSVLLVTQNDSNHDVFLRPEFGDDWLHPSAVRQALKWRVQQSFERAALLRKLRDQRKKLQEFERSSAESRRLHSIGYASAATANNLNNMLSAILGRASLLKAQLADSNAALQLGAMEQAAMKAAGTLRSIRKYSSHGESTSYEVIDLFEIAQQALAITRLRWEKADADRMNYAVSFQVQSPLPIRGLQNDLRDALCHLLDNAFESIADKGVIHISGKSTDGKAHLAIADTGRGIEDRYQRDIFEPFYSTKGSANAGLGLSVAQAILGRHGGSIEVSSSSGKGSTFLVSIPSCPEEEDRMEEMFPIQEKRLKILLVDDDADVLQVVGDIISICGHDVAKASDGREAKVLLKKGKFDLLITDLSMKVVSGWELAGYCRKVSPQTLIAVASGWMDEIQVIEENASSIDFTLTKPVSIDQFEAIFQQILRRSNAN